MPRRRHDNRDYYDWEDDPLGLNAAEEEQRRIDEEEQRRIDSHGNDGDSYASLNDNMEESDDKLAEEDLMPELKSRNVDSDDDESVDLMPGLESRYEDSDSDDDESVDHSTNPQPPPTSDNKRYFFDGEWFDKNHEDFDLMTDEDWMDLEDLYFCAGECEDDYKRKPKWRYTRIDWEHHIEQLQYTNNFQSAYHMSLDDLNKLIEILEDDVRVNEQQSRRSTGGNEPVSPQIIVATTVRFLLGDRIITLSELYGVSPPSLNRLINKCLKAIAASKHALLRVMLPNPKDRVKLRQLAQRWDRLSEAAGVFFGHLGAIDGWLARTEMPVDVTNKLAYRSGHYEC